MGFSFGTSWKGLWKAGAFQMIWAVVFRGYSAGMGVIQARLLSTQSGFHYLLYLSFRVRFYFRAKLKPSLKPTILIFQISKLSLEGQITCRVSPWSNSRQAFPHCISFLGLL
jgi:hypothetical protein